MPRIDPIIGSRPYQKLLPSVDHRIYAVADIEGCVRELSILRGLIAQERQKCKADEIDWQIVYLGNYVGQGQSSADVIDMFVSAPIAGVSERFLLGRNDLLFTNFVLGHSFSAEWLLNEGGLGIIESYGVEVSKFQNLDFTALRQELLKKIPPDHIAFLKSFALSETIGDYFFVHAAIDPDRALSKQAPSDLINSNAKFLQTKRKFEKIVVHGHDDKLMPIERDNRIGLNTSCVKTGVLSCLVLEGETRDIIQITSNSDRAMN